MYDAVPHFDFDNVRWGGCSERVFAPQADEAGWGSWRAAHWPVMPHTHTMSRDTKKVQKQNPPKRRVRHSRHAPPTQVCQGARARVC